MQTNRSETRSISIGVPPDAVLDIVGDARTLPSWAPGFARAIEADGELWVIDTGAGEARIDVRVAREQGTVDIVSADDPRRGAFTRVLPNGVGSEYLFTLFFPETAGEDAIAAQMAVVEAELRAVRDLCKAT
jgi:hypothetical protein